MDKKTLETLYDIELELHRLAAAVQAAEEAWQDAVGKRILAIEALSDMETFSIASIKAWLKRDLAAQREQLQQQVRQAESAVEHTRWQLDNQKRELQQLQAERDRFPDHQQLADWIQDVPDLLPLHSRLEIQLCLTALPTLLDRNIEGLTELYGFLRGGRSGELLSYEEQQQIYVQPDTYGEQCATWLRRLQKALENLGSTFEIPAYYHNPRSYIVSAAAQFNRIDRARNALDQAREIKICILQLQGGEEYP